MSEARLSGFDRDRLGHARYVRAAQRNGWCDDWEALSEHHKEQWRVGMVDAFLAIVDVFGFVPASPDNVN